VAREPGRGRLAGMAIVVIPDGVDLGAAPDVLLFFHGMGNLGYRERTTDDQQRGRAYLDELDDNGL
jgi:hypothetical protein